MTEAPPLPPSQHHCVGMNRNYNNNSLLFAYIYIYLYSDKDLENTSVATGPKNKIHIRRAGGYNIGYKIYKKRNYYLIY